MMATNADKVRRCLRRGPPTYKAKLGGEYCVRCDYRREFHEQVEAKVKSEQTGQSSTAGRESPR